MKRSVLVALVAMLCCLMAVSTFAHADDLGAIKSISIKTLPKTEYLIDEPFTVEGGVITAVYENGTKDIPMDDPAVEIKKPNLSRAGNKNVQLKFEGEKEAFKVVVSAAGLTFTFDLNLPGAGEPICQEVEKGAKAKKIDAPEYAGYAFYQWYSDPECTQVYNFAAPVEEDTTVYAFWKKNDAQYCTVAFDLNYYGCKTAPSEELVAAGENGRMPGYTPERVGYTFTGWSNAAVDGAVYHFDEPVQADMTLFAQWERVQTGAVIYVFEAEDVDLSQKAGPGYSGENAGSAMVIVNKNVDASQNMFVAYQCKNGNSLEFYLASDKATYAKLIVRFAAEFSDMTINSDMYCVSVNDVPVTYADVYLALSEGQQQGQFMDIDLGTIQLNEGANLIQLKTTNSEGLGGTLTATAPIIDCIKLETEAAVIWDGTYKLPATNY